MMDNSQKRILAPKPPMGWNSWDVYGTTVTEGEVLANARYMAENLARFGWEYVVVDIQWYTPVTKAHGYIPDPTNVTLDQYGRLTPAENRFPSAANGAGFKPLADAVHALGLKFGIHIMRGVPRHAVDRNLPILGTPYHAADIADKTRVCEWGNQVDMYGIDVTKPGGQEYYDSIAALYAEWGVDYIKADDILRPYHASEVEALSRALKKTGRDIVLSLSPGAPPLEIADHLKAHCNLWRISDDFWDKWEDLRDQFARIDNWSRHIGTGTWPDADMLPLGRISIRGERGDERFTNFTPDEQRTLMTLWCIARSPLMFGGDLPSNDQFTLDLITNAEILAMNQDSSANRQSYREGNIVAWTADAPNGDRYFAVFNIGDAPRDIDLPWKTVGIDAASSTVRDLWTHTDMVPQPTLRTTLAPHAATALRVSMR